MGLLLATGFVCLCWRGPQYDNFEEKLARKLLWSYANELVLLPHDRA